MSPDENDTGCLVALPTKKREEEGRDDQQIVQPSDGVSQLSGKTSHPFSTRPGGDGWWPARFQFDRSAARAGLASFVRCYWHRPRAGKFARMTLLHANFQLVKTRPDAFDCQSCPIELEHGMLTSVTKIKTLLRLTRSKGVCLESDIKGEERTPQNEGK